LALEQVAASGLSVGEYALRHGADADRLYRWRRRFAGEREQVRAMPVAAAPIVELRTASRRPEPVEIVLASGVMLRVAETIEPAALARLITALR
jgi:transposase-like protein